MKYKSNIGGYTFIFDSDDQSLTKFYGTNVITFSEERMKEIQKAYTGLDGIHKPMALRFWIDCRLGKINGYETIGVNPIPNLQQQEQILHSYIGCIREMLEPEQIEECNRYYDDTGDTDILHQFCDPNMTMWDAYQHVMEITLDIDNEPLMNIIYNLFEDAFKQEFKNQ